MGRVDYVQSVVRTRVLEKDLLTSARFEQLVDTEALADLWQALKTTKYASYLTDDMSFHQYEIVLENMLSDQYELVKELTIDPKAIEILQIKYDYHNLKVLFKAYYLETDLRHLYSKLSTVSAENLQAYLEDNMSENLDESMIEAINHVKAHFEKTKDPQALEILLDKLYMKDLYERVITLDMPLMLEYIEAYIDFLNVRTLIRVQKQDKALDFLKEVLLENGRIEHEKLLYARHDSPLNLIRKFADETIGKALTKGLKAYERTGSLTLLEKEMDNYLMSLINEAAHIHFGPEPLIAYLIKIEAEIENLRLIFTSKLNHISVDRIKKRMRDIYE